jgi:hypothetical protein
MPYPPAGDNSTGRPRYAIPDAIYDGAYILDEFPKNVTSLFTSQEAIFYIAVLPQMLDLYQYITTTQTDTCLFGGYLQGLEEGNFDVTTTEPLGVLGGSTTIVKCQLYNSTYQLRFNFTNGGQSVDVRMPAMETDRPVSVTNGVRGPGVNIAYGLSSDGVPISPGKISPTWENATCNTLNQNTTERGQACTYDSALVPQLAYQGLLQAFTSLLTGNLTLGGPNSYFGTEGGIQDNAYIRSTSLMKSLELTPLTDYAILQDSPSRGQYLYLQSALSNGSIAGASGISRLEDNADALPLVSAIETMFRNITVSLMSDSAFL